MQKELDALCGFNIGRISQYERGLRKPKRDTLQKIAEALKVDIEEFDTPDITTERGQAILLKQLSTQYGIDIQIQNKDFREQYMKIDI